MQLLGYDFQTLYMYGLIIAGSLTLLYMLFGDVFHIDPGSVLNPTVVLGFFAILSGSGYAFELTTHWSSVTILIISALIALVLVSIIHFFILVPLSKTEENTAYSIHDLVGKTAEVNVTIPENGLGEVVISSGHGLNGKMARSRDNKEIKEETKVKVVEVEDGVLVVEPINT